MSGQYSLSHSVAFGVIAGCAMFLLTGLLSHNATTQMWVQAAPAATQTLAAQSLQVSGRLPMAFPMQRLDANVAADMNIGETEIVTSISGAFKWQPVLAIGSILSALFALHWVTRPSTGSSWTMAATSDAPSQRKAGIQFIRGIDELATPGVKLTRSRDGSNGQATFRFDKPSAFDAANELGQITGMYMTDDEGTISTAQVTAKFVNGVPSTIEAVYTMRSKEEWDRFMRFMERYAEDNGLGFNKA